MKKLLESYAGDEMAIETIIAARAALVDLCIATHKYMLAQRWGDESYPMPVKEAAEAGNAVKQLNQMCEEKEIPPVFTGDITNVQDLYDYSRKVTKEIMKKMWG